MKKLFVCASLVGITSGVIYWLYNKEKANNTTTKSLVNEDNFKSESQEQNIPEKLNTMEEMYHAKGENAQNIYERHSEASKIMKDAYSNIMEDFVEDFSDEKNVNEKDKNKEIIDDESVSDMKELDSISDEMVDYSQ